MMARASLPGGTSGPGGIGSTVQAPKTAPVTNQQQIILRLPDDLAVRVRKLLEEGNELMDVEPQESDRFLVKIQGEQYPALLTNLPTNIETHKTFDNKIFLKSGDIGQVLIVFKTEKERDKAEASIVKTINGEYFPDGLTFPTKDIVKRKFELTRKAEPYPVHRVRTVMDEIKKEWLATAVPAQDGATADEGEQKESCETVYEEVVDFEDWMVSEEEPDGITIEISGRDWMRSTSVPAGAGDSSRDRDIAGWLLLQEHPEILLTEEDIEEDKDREAYEQLMKEAAAAAAAAAAPSSAVGGVGGVGGGALPGGAAAEEGDSIAEKLSLRITKTHTAAAGGADSTAGVEGESSTAMEVVAEEETGTAAAVTTVVDGDVRADMDTDMKVQSDAEAGDDAAVEGSEEEGDGDDDGASSSSSEDDEAWMDEIKANNSGAAMTATVDDGNEGDGDVNKGESGGGGGGTGGDEDGEEEEEEEGDDDDNAWLEEV